MNYSQLLLFIYLGVLASALLIRRLKPLNEVDFTIGNRNLGLFPFVATIVATAYGWILAVGESYYNDGITAWIYLSLPYTIGFILFAILFAKKARNTNYVTLTDLLLKNYGSKVATFASLFLVLYLFPAMYVLMAGQLLQPILGINIVWCLLIATAFSTVYVYSGGFRSVIFTDVFQFIIMFVGFAAVCVYLVYTYDDIDSQLIEPYTSFNFSGSWLYILTFSLIASFTLIDPSVYQRVYAVKKPRTAVKGIFIAVLCWVVFDIMEATTGIFSRILLPNINPALAYPELATQILPNILSAVFMISMLAVIMSTTDSFLFLSALTLSKDVLKPNGLFKNTKTDQLTRYCLIVVSVLCFFTTYLYRNGSAIDLFFDLYPIIVSTLLLPVICTYYPKLTLKSKQVMLQMIVSFVICITYIIIQPKLGADFTEINAVFMGLGTAFIMQIIFSTINRK